MPKSLKQMQKERAILSFRSVSSVFANRPTAGNYRMLERCMKAYALAYQANLDLSEAAQADEYHQMEAGYTEAQIDRQPADVLL